MEYSLVEVQRDWSDQHTCLCTLNAATDFVVGFMGQRTPRQSGVIHPPLPYPSGNAPKTSED